MDKNIIIVGVVILILVIVFNSGSKITPANNSTFNQTEMMPQDTSKEFPYFILFVGIIAGYALRWFHKRNEDSDTFKSEEDAEIFLMEHSKRNGFYPYEIIQFEVSAEKKSAQGIMKITNKNLKLFNKYVYFVLLKNYGMIYDLVSPVAKPSIEMGKKWEKFTYPPRTGYISSNRRPSWKFWEGDK